MFFYKSLSYNSKSRWLSYWYQISETIKKEPKKVLIIGKGAGIVEVVIGLLAPQIKIFSCDIEFKLYPDIVADIKNLPIREKSIDIIICCQVLEHIKWEFIEEILENFKNLAKTCVIISVPQKRKYIKFEIDFPYIGCKRLILKYPFCKKETSSKQHCWELNRGISKKRFEKLIQKFFKIEKTFLNEINCEHRFYILSPKTERS